MPSSHFDCPSCGRHRENGIRAGSLLILRCAFCGFRDGDTMPVFVIKARDNLSVEAVRGYHDLCVRHGLAAQAAQVNLALHEIAEWRIANPHLCKWPDHDHVPAGESGSGSEHG